MGSIYPVNNSTSRTLSVIRCCAFAVTRSCRQFFYSLTLAAGLSCAGIVSASDTATAENARQSLLFRIDAAGLHLTRRDILDGGSTALVVGLNESARGSVISPNSDSASGQPTELQAAIPYAQWVDSDGMTIAVTRFEEPRIARVPQQGRLVHEAVLGQSTAFFLLRGPASAVTVNVFLPELALAQSHDLRSPDARGGATGQQAKKIADASQEAFRQVEPQNSPLQDVLQKQSWQVELPQ